MFPALLPSNISALKQVTKQKILVRNESGDVMHLSSIYPREIKCDMATNSGWIKNMACY